MGAPWGGPICPGRCWAPCIGDCSAPACTPGKTILCELRIPTRLFNKKKSRLFNQKSFLLQSTQCLQECQSHASPPPPFVHCKFSLSSPKINRTLFFLIFFSPLLLFFFSLPFSTPPEPLLLVAESPDSIGTQKCCRSKPRLPSWFRNPLEGGERRNKMGGDFFFIFLY